MATRAQQREQSAADALAALGNRTRLRVFKLLVRAGPQGTNIGAIQRMLGIPATTLGHHLGTLAAAGWAVGSCAPMVRGPSLNPQPTRARSASVAGARLAANRPG